MFLGALVVAGEQHGNRLAASDEYRPDILGRESAQCGERAPRQWGIAAAGTHSRRVRPNSKYLTTRTLLLDHDPSATLCFAERGPSLNAARLDGFSDFIKGKRSGGQLGPESISLEKHQTRERASR